MRSGCCSADVRVELRAEVFHGCDDEYDLKIPFYYCSSCGELISPLFERVETKKVPKIGGKSYE